MNRSFHFSVGEYYHIYNRGVDKRETFLDSLDYERFILALVNANNKETCHIGNIKKQLKGEYKGIETCLALREVTLVDIGAWCLMPNHFHLLVKEKEEGGVVKFMQRLETGYTMYFNKKNERTGSLFQGTFKAEHAHNDNYLKYLFSYIHLNPVKLIQSDWKEKGIKDINKTLNFLAKFYRSSYLDHLDVDRLEKGIINKDAFPDYFPDKDSFKKEIFDWLKLEH
ncbi:MAG: transposase [Minisyncoccia bacterium]